jgi:hypothetical protein
VIPILQEEPVYVVTGGTKDIEAFLRAKPGEVVACDGPLETREIRPARQWYEPIEDEL